MDNLGKDLIIMLIVIVVVAILLHKYGAYILTGLGIAGAAKLAKNLLPSGVIVAPTKGSAAEKAIINEAVADGEITASQAATATLTEGGEVAATAAAETAAEGAAAELAAGTAAEVSGEVILEELAAGAAMAL